MKLSVWPERSNFKRKSTLEKSVLPFFSLNSNKIGCLFFPIPSFGSNYGQTPTTTPSVPRVINTDKNAAYPKAIAKLKAAGILPEHVELRQVKYLNNLIEQDHRFIKRLVKPGLVFFSLETAWRTLQEYEAMHMIRKGQMQGVKKGDSTSQAAFIALVVWSDHLSPAG